MTHMVGNADAVVVRDTGHAVVEDTHNAGGAPSPPRGLESGSD